MLNHDKIETRVGLLMALTLFAVSIGGMVDAGTTERGS